MEGLEILLQNYSKHHIDVTVGSIGSKNWWLTGFYWEPEQSRKISLGI